MSKRGKISESAFKYKILIYLILIIITITVIVPVAWVFMASIKENSEFYGQSPWKLPKGFYYQNFIDAFYNAKMDTYMLNSVIVTALALALLIIIALPAAYVLSRYAFKGSKFINTLFMGGLFINVNYIVVPIFLMLVDADKFLKEVLRLKNGFFLNNLFVLALVYAATALPFSIYLLSSYFVTIPKEYEEAAFVDGSGHMYTMIRIMLPMARPSIITVILFNFLAFWNEYIISMTLMTKQDLKTLPVGLVRIMATQRASTNYGQLYAGLVMVMLPTLILYIFVQRKLTQGMNIGGIKG